MLTKDDKRRIIQYRGLALGIFQSIFLVPTSNEYDIRNVFSRLYYAFYHASLALLVSQGIDIDEIRKDHGRVHREIDRRLGKAMGKFFRELYSARQQADYEPNLFAMRYQGDIDRARLDADVLLGRARTHFNWLQQESAKILKDE